MRIVAVPIGNGPAAHIIQEASSRIQKTGVGNMKVRLANQDSFERLAQSMGDMIDKLYHNSYVGFRSSKSWEPPVNVYEDAEQVLICAELSGMRRDDIDVQVTPERLTIRGSRSDPRLPDQPSPCRVHLLEIRHGPFSRTINLRPNLDIDNAQAQYCNGYLWVRLPKQER